MVYRNHCICICTPASRTWSVLSSFCFRLFLSRRSSICTQQSPQPDSRSHVSRYSWARPFDCWLVIIKVTIHCGVAVLASLRADLDSISFDSSVRFERLSLARAGVLHPAVLTPPPSQVVADATNSSVPRPEAGRDGSVLPWTPWYGFCFAY